MDRIDRVELKITGFSSFVGTQCVAFTVDVTDQNSLLVRAIAQEWAAWYEKLIADGKTKGDAGITDVLHI